MIGGITSKRSICELSNEEGMRGWETGMQYIYIYIYTRVFLPLSVRIGIGLPSTLFYVNSLRNKIRHCSSRANIPLVFIISFFFISV